MILILKAVSLNDQPLSQSITACFDASGGTIGRADHNTLALPDPERHISRLQAEIAPRGAGYLIRNVGSASYILIGGRSLAHGETAELAQDDLVRVGGYLLQVDYRDQSQAVHEITRGRPLRQALDAPPPVAAAKPAAITAPSATPAALWPSSPPAPSPAWPAAPAAAKAPAINPFADLLGAGPADAVSIGNPFADLLGPGSPPAPPPPPMPLPRPAAVTPMAMPSAPAPAWPDQTEADPFALITPRPAPAPFTSDPFDSLMPGPAGVPAQSAALASSPAPAPRLPADFDPFAPPAPVRAPPAALARSPASLFDDLGLGIRPALMDQAFGLDGPDQGDALANFMAQATAPPPPAGGAGKMSTDPLALFPAADAAVPGPQGRGSPGAPAGAAESAAPAQSDHVPAIHAAFKLPQWQTPGQVAGPAAAPPPPPADALPAPAPMAAVAPPPELPAPAWRDGPVPPPRGASRAQARGQLDHGSPDRKNGEDNDAAALWAAFCQGAGIDLPLPPGTGPERMRVLGQVLNSAVGGALQLMSVRASTKYEFRAGNTVIQARNNNPLKFSPDARAAILQLVQPAANGFLDGPAAMEEAMNDLVGHAIGTAAGIRAAIEGMLDRFDPSALEAKLSPGSMMDNLLPGSRRARLWDLYLQHHGAIREEAQEDFHTLFGKAFLAAYEQQIARLKAGTGPR